MRLVVMWTLGIKRIAKTTCADGRRAASLVRQALPSLDHPSEPRPLAGAGPPQRAKTARRGPRESQRRMEHPLLRGNQDSKNLGWATRPLSLSYTGESYFMPKDATTCCDIADCLGLWILPPFDPWLPTRSRHVAGKHEPNLFGSGSLRVYPRPARRDPKLRN